MAACSGNAARNRAMEFATLTRTDLARALRMLSLAVRDNPAWPDLTRLAPLGTAVMMGDKGKECGLNAMALLLLSTHR